MESRKMVGLTYSQDSNKDINLEYRPVDKVGEGKGGTNRESRNGSIYITICKIDRQWEFAV